MSDRLIAIGDPHGCSVALRTLVEAISPTERDRIVPLGDYIDRGPDSRGVIEQLLELQTACQLFPLLGNHEEMMLAVLNERAPFGWWMQHGGRETLASYGYEGDLACLPQEHLDFIQGCLPYYETDNHLFVHANYVADEPLDQQPAEALRWQSLNEHYPERHASGKTAIMGHTSQKSGEIFDARHLKCIDTFCFGGGWLTAMDVENGTVWQANNDGQLR